MAGIQEAAPARGGLLCHGIRWPSSDGVPRLALGAADGVADVVLDPGTRLSFAVAAGRWCLGHTRVRGRRDRTAVECPAASPAERGHQCGPCFARDETRHMHDFHRSGSAPAGLRDYLAQEHWLYVASFANGASKVGTAAAVGKWRRLAEQGAVAASYVALADDGGAVRILEDLVTESLGLGQSVRAAAKAGALAGPGGAHDAVSLAGLNGELARRVGSFLERSAEASEVPFSTRAEPWVAPTAAADLLRGWDARTLHSYPGALDRGAHGFTAASVLGQALEVRLDGSGDRFLADASVLKGRRLLFGAHSTAVPLLQDALF